MFMKIDCNERFLQSGRDFSSAGTLFSRPVSALVGFLSWLLAGKSAA